MPEEKTFPVKDPEIIAKMQADYSAKLAKNKENGKRALETNEFRPYDGVSGKYMEQQFYAMLMLDHESARIIDERAIKPIGEIARKYDIPSIFAAKGDLPPHISIDVGNFDDLTPEQEKFARDWLMSPSSHLKTLIPILTGIKIHLDALVVAPNIYVCSSKFDEEQGGPYKARRIIEKAMRRAVDVTTGAIKEPMKGHIGPPYRYDDILYVSLGRVIDHAPTSALKSFLDEVYSTVGADIEKDPLVVTTAGVYEGRSVDFYKTFAPQLIKS